MHPATAARGWGGGTKGMCTTDTHGLRNSNVYMAGDTLPGAVASSTLARSDHGQSVQKLYPKESMDIKYGVCGSVSVCVIVCM